MYGATAEFATRKQIQQLEEAWPSRRDCPKAAPSDERWDVNVVSVILQLFLWVGSWGIVDAGIQKVAPDRADHRFVCYGVVTGFGALLAPALLHIQAASQKGKPLGPNDSFPASVLCLGFMIAVALCSGLWGMIDSVVEDFAGDDADIQIKGYVLLTTIAAFGAAIHHRFFPNHVLDQVGQLTVV